MSRLTLRLPQSLHFQLSGLAKAEGVSLNQYIVYALSQQATITSGYTVRRVSDSDIAQQEANFKALLDAMPKASQAQIDEILANREPVQPEDGLSAELIEKIEQRIRAQQQQPEPEVG